MRPAFQGWVAACAAAVAAVGVVAPTASAQPTFTLLGQAPGATGSLVSALSADGRVAAGYSGGAIGFSPGFVWSGATGREDFGLEAGLPPETLATAISGNGGVAAGRGTLNGVTRAFRWSGPGTFQTLGVVPNYGRSLGTGISGDGSVVVGTCDTILSQSAQAFRWTPSGGMQGLGFVRPTDIHSEANAISRDGSTIVGSSADSGGFAQAYSWTQAGGFRVLPPLPSVTTATAYAFGVNSTGSMAVGVSSGDEQRAVMWVNGVALDLGVAPGWGRSIATGISDDGGVVIGRMSTPTVQVPAVWTPTTGMVPLADYLGIHGITLPAGWLLGGNYCVSGDGRSIAGAVGIPDLGSSQGIVFNIPAPGACPIVVVVLFVLSRRRRG